MKRQTLFFAITITIALAAGFWFGEFFLGHQDTTSPPNSHVMLLETPRQLAIPAIQQDNGSPFDTASLQGKWSLLFFGFTHCPDVCPATLNTVAQTKREYEKQTSEQNQAPFPQVVFISIDPQRDNASMVGEYVRYFDKDFIGATGEEKLLRAITVQLYSNFMIQPSDNESEYQVGHSLKLVLINPEAQLVAVLNPPHTVESILDVLQHFQ